MFKTLIAASIQLVSRWFFKIPWPLIIRRRKPINFQLINIACILYGVDRIPSYMTAKIKMLPLKIFVLGMILRIRLFLFIFYLSISSLNILMTGSPVEPLIGNKLLSSILCWDSYVQQATLPFTAVYFLRHLFLTILVLWTISSFLSRSILFKYIALYLVVVPFYTHSDVQFVAITFRLWTKKALAHVMGIALSCFIRIDVM